MHFDYFVIPFSAGSVFLFGIILYKFLFWFQKLSASDKKLFRKGIISTKIFTGTGEVIMESLIHRKMFLSKPLMGYMHMTFALGWFLLIALGNLESRLHHLTSFNLPYYPIFFKFFTHEKPNILPNVFSFVMDFILLVVLSGVLLALIKRFSSGIFGLKKTTRQTTLDKFALISLWLIFPLRFLAESFSASYWHAGGFATNAAGVWLDTFLPVDKLIYPSWWAYSLSLGVFFVTLPWSRYMHIPAEVLLIYARKFGMKSEKEWNSYSVLEVNSCPRCGLCIDACQLNFSANITDTQPAYFIRSVRENKVAVDKANNCLICGRCLEACPVGIETNNIRLQQRKKFADDYLSEFAYITDKHPQKVDYLYFGGCMTHLTPGIIRSMKKIFNTAGIDYLFIDEDGSVCCGRPMMLSGNFESANNLMEYNKKMIYKSGAKYLVTSCPICFRIFREDYNLNITVLHHTQFILDLIDKGKINLNPNSLSVAYHDPCELGRNSNIYEEPRKVLKNISTLTFVNREKENALCCGGSLGLFEIKLNERDKLIKDVVNELSEYNPDMIVTACPLCKKTLAKKSDIPVKDIAELVAIALVEDIVVVKD